MEQKKIINWGIIGLGKIARKFTTDLLTVPGANLYAVASRSQEKADNFASEFGADNAYGSYEDLAKDPNVDAVYIATPHVFHKENSLLCLNNGIAVLCEKPFSMNLEDIEVMIAASKANNTLLMEALWTYFLPHYQHVLKLIQDKIFGEVLELQANFGFKPEYDPNSRVVKKDLGGGSLLDIGIYPIFAALSTLGKPNHIDAEATFFDNGADSSCHMTFHYDRGVKAILKSTLLEKTATTATFFCETGIIKVNSRFHEPSTITLIPVDGEEKILDFGYTTIGYSFEANHFNELIRQGNTESPIMTFDFSRDLMKTMDSIRKKIGLEYN